MTTFDKAVDFVLAHEGGYSMDPNDPGGETNFGISKRAYPDLDIKALTRDAAIEIYRRDYWNVCHCYEIPAQLAMMLFDSAVNQGPNAAVRLLQTSLKVTADGVMGPNTVLAALNANPKPALSEFAAQRGFRYAKDSNVQLYGLGWMRRLMDCCQLTQDPL